MRFRGIRLLGGLAFSFLVGLNLPACSGQQEGDEQMEVTDEQGNQTNESGEEEAPSEGYNEETDNTAEEGNAEESGYDSGYEGGEEVAEGGEQATENDLQEIIQEMNGQPTDSANSAGNAQAAPLGGGEAANTAAMPEAAPEQSAVPTDAPAAVSSTTAPFQPGGSPAGQGLPEIGSKMAYIVQSGDTLGKIAAKVYGNSNRWKEMASLSGIDNPSRIYPGDVVYYTLEETSVPFATAYETVQRSEETVKPGDTLATIAQRVYGSSKSWKAIWRQNDNINNPDIVTPGSTVYYISSGALSAAVGKIKIELAKISKNAPVSSGFSDVNLSGHKVVNSGSGIVLAYSHSNSSVMNVENLN
jgi:nucleoid-associated protein YgaU